MVMGIGIDLTDVSRIRDSIDRYGERFLDRIFTPAERAACAQQRNAAEGYAARFAAKEAAAKALGTGIVETIGWKDFEVLREPGARPHLVLHGAAHALAAARGICRIHLSLTHTETMAAATVVLESD